MHRQGLRTVLSIRPTWNNDIVYIETDEVPVEIRIMKQQIKFWSAIETIRSNPTHYITKLVNKAEVLNIKYIDYYKNLVNTYKTPEGCQQIVSAQHRDKIVRKIRDEAQNDPDSRLGSYLSINPGLTKPTYTNVLEFQRVTISRYRTGSHNLKIETGRRPPRVEREDRLCKCNTGVQTLKHCLLKCPLLDDARMMHGLVDVVSGVRNIDFLMKMERVLKLQR